MASIEHAFQKRSVSSVGDAVVAVCANQEKGSLDVSVLLQGVENLLGVFSWAIIEGEGDLALHGALGKIDSIWDTSKTGTRHVSSGESRR